MRQDLANIERKIDESSTWQGLKTFLNEHLEIGDKISISILDIIIVITVIFITSLLLKLFLKIITRNLLPENKSKFN